jgi:hypothetical protein
MALPATQLPAMAWPAHGASAMAWPASQPLAICCCQLEVAGKAIAGTWSVGYGVAGVPGAGDILLTTGSPFMLGILINTLMCHIFAQINVYALYILVKLPVTLMVQ